MLGEEREEAAPGRLKRLTKLLDGFAGAFMRGGQSGNALHYLLGLLGDAKRKNREGTLQRLCGPGQYQTLQHFITHSTWDAGRSGRSLEFTLRNAVRRS
jgi:hypothetical protein